MELKIKDEVKEEAQERTFSVKKLEEVGDEKVSAPNTLFSEPEPVRITATEIKAATAKSGNNIMEIVKWVVILAVVLLGVKLVAGIVNPKTTDVSLYVDMEKDALEAKLDVELENSPNMVNRITHYSNGTVTVDGDGKIGVVYIDGVRKGIHIDDKRYKMYGVSIGDGEYQIEDNITYDYENYFNVLNDMVSGNSTAWFYYNSSQNDCMVVIVNDNSARVVAMTYFNDYKLISENLSGIDE
ncbi:MAG: hypothetical protein E7257_10785 [Lachnospiraceae bacterium]|nr:hypothetical protein [Lachnospiraceae bacterium]